VLTIIVLGTYRYNIGTKIPHLVESVIDWGGEKTHGIQ
jgi:hypothetical protein